MKYAHIVAGGSILASGVAAQAYTEFHFYPEGPFPRIVRFREYLTMKLYPSYLTVLNQ
jgi:hypothetical protein